MAMERRLIQAIVLSVLFVLLSSRAAAEESEQALEESDGGPDQGIDSLEEARSLFEQGTSALEDARFTEARDLLRRSFALHSSSATAFNLALALRSTGDTEESLAVLDSLLEGEHGELSEDQVSEVRQLRAESLLELATLYVRVSGAPSIEVRIDGALTAVIAGGDQIQRQLSAGTRLVSASAPGFQQIERHVTLLRGRSSSLDLVLTAPVVEEPQVRPDEPPTEEPVRVETPRSFVRRPWFWVVMGLAAATVGVGIWLAVDQPWSTNASNAWGGTVFTLTPGEAEP